MPRKSDPGAIRVGAGQRTVEEEAVDLTGVVGTPAIGSVPPTSALPTGVGPSLGTHLTTPRNAHSASAISIDGLPPLYVSGNVEGALDELSALIPPRPSTLGNYRTYLPISGIPDWGILKLFDAPLTVNEPLAFVSTANPPSEIYPYYWHPPHPAQDNPPFEPVGTPFIDEGGNDPSTDLTFNIASGGYVGGGPGRVHAGGFTRDVGGPNPVTQTMRILDFGGANRDCVISGAIYPADRGVIALLHWPSDGDIADFLAQPLEERVLAAILLGQGTNGQSNTRCDGAPGGIFGVGSNPNGFDPFEYPGLATGQFDLRELHEGLYGADVGVPLTGTPLPAPWDDLDGDTITGAPAAGQVRLGTDPNAGITPITDGIPILGASTSARGGVGNDDNFFRYRLPYLQNYTTGTGLVYTPEAQRPRYYKKPTVSLNAGTDLTQGGDFPNLTKDYWFFQLGRFRHQFSLVNAGASPREAGAYILAHFKTEKAFEDLVRDGTVPASADLWSANMVDWTDPEDPTNLASGTGITDVATPYHILRAAVIEDTEGAASPTISVATFDYSNTVDEVVWVSGVRYFLPLDSLGSPSFFINTITVTSTDFWENTYRTYADQSVALNTPNPMFLSLSPFSYTTENLGYITTPIGIEARQRIEFQFDDLGAYTLANGPLPADTATISAGGNIELGGDNTNPAFSADARVRVFMRRPLLHQTAAGYPISALVPPLDSNLILFHSTDYISGGSPKYGNFVDGLNDALPSLEFADKDVNERFLDEVYRYHSVWPGVAAGIDLATQENLEGPGLPHGLGVIEVPVRAGTTAVAGFDDSSWVQLLHHEGSLGDPLLLTESQVSGMPDRNPPLSDGATSPFPSAGVVKYPEKDYSTGYRPSLFDGDLTLTAQPDYSALIGLRSYVRAFDVAFSNSGSPVVAEGSAFFKIKILGMKLEDFEYDPPGPGKEVSIQVKVPGFTTWMDLGRNDGAGPSKQDAVSDGAGCRVLGPNTFDGVDAPSGLHYAQVYVHVGPAITLFKSANGEVPVLVKVSHKDSVDARKYDMEYDFLNLGDDPDASAANVRGVVGIEIIR